MNWGKIRSHFYTLFCFSCVSIFMTSTILDIIYGKTDIPAINLFCSFFVMFIIVTWRTIAVIQYTGKTQNDKSKND